MLCFGHFSKENNFPELAYKTVVDEANAKPYFGFGSLRFLLLHENLCIKQS